MVPEQNFLVAVDSTIYTAKVFTILCLDGHTIFCEISRQIHSIGDTPLVLYMMATYDRFIWQIRRFLRYQIALYY